MTEIASPDFGENVMSVSVGFHLNAAGRSKRLLPYQIYTPINRLRNASKPEFIK